MKDQLTLGTLSYSFDQLNDWASWQKKVDGILTEAKKQQVDILLFPEYFGLELCGWSQHADLLEQVRFIQNLIPSFLQWFQQKSDESGMMIVAGTILVRDVTALGEEKYFNRSYIFTPNDQQSPFYQDKLYLTQYEKQLDWIRAGNKDQIQLVPSKNWGPLGVAICYDSEFPLLVHHMVKEGGAKIILVPSCTETDHGFHRVYLSCRARAIENQCFVAVAATVGSAPWCEVIDTNCGQANILSPIDGPFPSNGIIHSGQKNLFDCVVATIDLKQIDLVRHHGQVSNYLDW